MKCDASQRYDARPRRSPCGERGLKFSDTPEKTALNASLPVRGAWIEIKVYAKLLRNKYVAPRAGSVD